MCGPELRIEKHNTVFFIRISSFLLNIDILNFLTFLLLYLFSQLTEKDGRTHHFAAVSEESYQTLLTLLSKILQSSKHAGIIFVSVYLAFVI